MPIDLPTELLSGPDLGGGFLFQLTQEPTGFTFHAQEAGSDAAQPPAGSPSTIGFRHPPVACMFGGPACWHLELPGLAVADRSRVRVAYNRTRFVIDPMLAQAGRARPSPMAEGLRELAAKIAAPLAAANVAWEIGGSAGAWLRGAEIAPADIDLSIDAAECARLAELLDEYLVVPNHATPGSDGRPRTRGAAFVGTLKAGLRVEWGGAPPDLPSTAPLSEWEGPGWIERRQWVDRDGFRLPVAPVEFEIVRLAERGQDERLRTLLRSPVRSTVDRGLLGRIFEASAVDPRARGQLLAAFA